MITVASPHGMTYDDRPAYRRFVLALLMLSYGCCHLDRNIVTILLAPIKAEFGVSDTALGLLTGLTFAVFYGLLGIPLGYIADRSNRRHLLGASLTLFSGLTLASGLATSFGQLVGARIGVGVGEGGAVPTAQSIIADMYPPERRVFALGLYSSGLSLGALLGLGIGGLVSQAYGWRTAFVVAGLISLAISLVCWKLIREPARRASASEAETSLKTPSMLESARYLLREQPAYRHLLIAASVAAIPGFSLLVWSPTLLSRAFGMPPAEIGLWLGLMFGAGGAIGILATSYASARMVRRSPGLALVPPMIGCCLVGISSILLVLAPSPVLALSFLAIPAAGYCCYTGPLYAAVHSIAGTRIRGRAIAFLLLVTNVAGFGVGPAAAGFLSDRLTPVFGEDSLRYALLITVAGWFWAAVHFGIASRELGKTKYLRTN
jgi:predicted MFS family arabinose efflux permease